MDCCENKSTDEINNKGGKMETKNIVMWVVIGVLAVAVIYVSFIKGATGAAVSTAQSASSYGGMVGGC